MIYLYRIFEQVLVINTEHGGYTFWKLERFVQDTTLGLLHCEQNDPNKLLTLCWQMQEELTFL